jgi:hypothetical protein
MASLATVVPVRALPQMLAGCQTHGCRFAVPSELEHTGLCLLHFTLSVEEISAAIRRETARGTTSQERQAEIIHYIGEQSELLARAATAGTRLSHEIKARVLATFLTLMNLRENLDHTADREAFLVRTASAPLSH